jgi:hypothetical protein
MTPNNEILLRVDVTPRNSELIETPSHSRSSHVHALERMARFVGNEI